ncbi:hypothetical protein [Roseomonas rosulenta]|uniref:hypothetical protein n=1 Tax=Roseomonas rosulenta TaxID=2748667 RepID=UPI0018DEEFD6|nr:hypothetical protein [Roseomonas rosulenta]
MTGNTAAPCRLRDKGLVLMGSMAMVPLAQFALVLGLAAGPVLLASSLLRARAAARPRRGGDPVAFPLRRRAS